MHPSKKVPPSCHTEINTVRLAKENDDHVLARICGIIASDEKRHEKAYYTSQYATVEAGEVGRADERGTTCARVCVWVSKHQGSIRKLQERSHEPAQKMKQHGAEFSWIFNKKVML
ncbi:hypothetical protein L6452_01275 [Arctium lappa]|uniref:Uncharacterized protein n=1 Tax=Arctium lappa TaxID=4217 RepID=A0ACB9FGF6_ARCLA|nr:hypothetical protein L6452_01275 [Arctium lappa]